MKDDIEFRTGNVRQAEAKDIEQTKDLTRCNHRRHKWWILPLAVLALAVIATAGFWLRQQSIGRQLKALADDQWAAYIEAPRGPGWYLRLAKKYNLPVFKRPVTFQSHNVTDKDVPVVGKALTLRKVDLYGSRISDAGMAHLKILKNLDSLHIYGRDIGDEGMANLSELTELVLLYATRTSLTDAGMVHLKGLKNMRILFLSDNNNLGDAGLEHLTQLPALRELALEGTNVTDAGLLHLKKIKSLDFLVLNGTKVTDAGLAHLKSLKRLKSLFVADTRVTPEGIADLKSALPALEVYPE